MCAASRLSEEIRKKEIMDAAAKEIIEKGFDNASMEGIIAGTSLSKGGVYHYYDSVLEIFKDLMVHGIEYRNDVIKENLKDYHEGLEKEFMARQLFLKIIDENPYMPLYVELLVSMKRHPELKALMVELQRDARERFITPGKDTPAWIKDNNIFQFMSNFINAMIIGSDLLEARENFKENRQLIENMFLCILKEGSENTHEDL